MVARTKQRDERRQVRTERLMSYQVVTLAGEEVQFAGDIVTP